MAKLYAAIVISYTPCVRPPLCSLIVSVAQQLIFLYAYHISSLVQLYKIALFVLVTCVIFFALLSLIVHIRLFLSLSLLPFLTSSPIDPRGSKGFLSVTSFL